MLVVSAAAMPVTMTSVSALVTATGSSRRTRAWSVTVSSGAARGLRTEPFRIEGLTSFGEDAAGELYATAESGVVFRIT